MTQVVRIRLREDQVDRLKRFARRMGKSQSEVGAQFIEESMREAEFAGIEFRDSVLGRQPYMKDSNLAVWEVILIAADHDMDAERVAAYFRRPRAWVNAAFHYYEAYQDELDPVLEDNRSMNFEKLKRLLPQLEAIPIPQSVLDGENIRVMLSLLLDQHISMEIAEQVRARRQRSPYEPL